MNYEYDDESGLLTLLQLLDFRFLHVSPVKLVKEEIRSLNTLINVFALNHSSTRA